MSVVMLDFHATEVGHFRSALEESWMSALEERERAIFAYLSFFYFFTLNTFRLKKKIEQKLEHFIITTEDFDALEKEFTT